MKHANLLKHSNLLNGSSNSNNRMNLYFSIIYNSARCVNASIVRPRGSYHGRARHLTRISFASGVAHSVTPEPRSGRSWPAAEETEHDY
jgi:hypothetical protein